jgi:RNA polymerase sigma-70 factor (ECF subfamily)
MVRNEFTETTWTSFRRVVLECEKPQTVADSLSITMNAVLISKSRILKRLREIGRGLIDQL